MNKNIKFKKLLKLPLVELINKANKTREYFLGAKLDICNILNAKSGLCSEDCKFCAQSGHHKTDIPVYSLKGKNEIIAAAKQAKKIGAKRFGVVTSGNCLTPRELDIICQAGSEIKNQIKIKLCASLGALSLEQLKKLKQSGFSRYHHNIETSPNFYKKIVTTHNFNERLETIKNAKIIGFEVCSGGIIGMGENWQDRISMACILRDLKIDSVPLNILVPVKGTPLDKIQPLSAIDAVRTIAIFRIILKDKTIKIAAGRETVFKDFQGAGFMAGANGMLIGGYLTVRGRSIYEDHCLIKEIKKIWNESKKS